MEDRPQRSMKTWALPLASLDAHPLLTHPLVLPPPQSLPWYSPLLNPSLVLPPPQSLPWYSPLLNPSPGSSPSSPPPLVLPPPHPLPCYSSPLARHPGPTAHFHLRKRARRKQILTKRQRGGHCPGFLENFFHITKNRNYSDQIRQCYTINVLFIY